MCSCDSGFGGFAFSCVFSVQKRVVPRLFYMLLSFCYTGVCLSFCFFASGHVMYVIWLL
jgi:hypothetical protein